MTFLRKEQMEKVDLSLPFAQQLATFRSSVVCERNSAIQTWPLDSCWLPCLPRLSLHLYISALLPLKLFWKRTPIWELSRSHGFQVGTEEKQFGQRKHRCINVLSQYTCYLKPRNQQAVTELRSAGAFNNHFKGSCLGHEVGAATAGPSTKL